MSGELAIALAAVLILAAVAAAVFAVRTRRVVATPTERGVHAALHTASLAARALRQGLDTDSADTAAPFLRGLTGTEGVAVFDGDGQLLACDPPDGALGRRIVLDACERAARESISGERRVLTQRKTSAVVAPAAARRRQRRPRRTGRGHDPLPAPGLLGAVGEVARYAASQIELAELDASRARLDRAEVLALRAQISPHFIYNALNTIASFVRTDPDRARELILEFADFTRYSFRAAGQYTTLTEELRNIDRYLNLERARFGSALKVRFRSHRRCSTSSCRFSRCSPWWRTQSGTASPGRAADESRSSPATRARTASSPSRTTASEWTPRRCAPDPATPWPTADGRRHSAHVGLTNVDHRLRAAFGNDYGLVVETAIGAGTKVVMRVPKFRSGVRAGGGAFECGHVVSRTRAGRHS